jgi:hypothetical protein
MGGQGGGVKTKKRKAALGADFSKVKHKVGRKLPPKKNETALDTRSKRINLPNQRVAEHETDGTSARSPVCAFKQTLCEMPSRRRRLTGGAPYRRRRTENDVWCSACASATSMTLFRATQPAAQPFAPSIKP